MLNMQQLCFNALFVLVYKYAERLRSSGGNLRAVAYYSQIVLGWTVRVQHKHIASMAAPVLTQ